AVELELLLQDRPHLPRAARDDGEPGVSLGVQLPDERRSPGDRTLLMRLLEGGPDELTEGVELGLEVGLVQVPAVDAPRGPWIDAVDEEAHVGGFSVRAGGGSAAPDRTRPPW